MPASNAELIVQLHLILLFLGELSLLIPIWAGYQRRRHLLRSHQIVLYCCIMWAVLTTMAECLVRTGHHNAAVWDLVSILETLLLGYAFYLELHSPKTKNIMRIIFLVFLFTSTFDYFNVLSLQESTVYIVALESFLLILVVLLYFEQLLRELQSIAFEREPMFLIGIGVITYFAGTVVIFMLQQKALITDNEQLIQLKIMMMINSILSIALNCIIARAFWLVGREQTVGARPLSQVQ